MIETRVEEFAARWVQRHKESKSDFAQFYEHNKSLLFNDFYNNVLEPYINSDEFQRLCEETNTKFIENLADYRYIAECDKNDLR